MLRQISPHQWTTAGLLCALAITPFFAGCIVDDRHPHHPPPAYYERYPGPHSVYVPDHPDDHHPDVQGEVIIR